jgi:NitT/TauT family transport system substrate-binding protein
MNIGMWNRRDFIGAAGAAGLLGANAVSAAAEPALETTRLRLMKATSLCWAPQYVAEELLRAEGFSDISYVDTGELPVAMHLAAGHADISMNFIAPNIIRVEAGDPVLFLAGAHVGCFEVIGGERVRRVSDLRGKTVSVPSFGDAAHVFLASILAYVGIDPRTQIDWVIHSGKERVELFKQGSIDAFVAFPPVAQRMRAAKIGHVVVNSTLDRPWSQYFCCLVTGSRDFVQKHPVATKRALRAFLKSVDLCATAPERVARRLVDAGVTPDYADALQVMKEVPYTHWRNYDPEDTLRFYALQLREAGMIKSTPQKIIAQSSDWRFLNELKRELKS